MNEIDWKTFKFLVQKSWAVCPIHLNLEKYIKLFLPVLSWYVGVLHNLASHSSTDLLTLIWSSMININSVNDTCCCVQLFQTCWMTKPWTTAQLLPQSIGHSRTRIKAIQPPTPTTQSPMALMAPISLSQYHQLRLTWLLTLLVTDRLNWQIFFQENWILLFCVCFHPRTSWFHHYRKIQNTER